MADIQARYMELAMMQEIPSVAEYAVEWMKLAADAEAADRPAMAEMARKRGAFYAKQDEGTYIRLLEGSFSELVQV